MLDRRLLANYFSQIELFYAPKRSTTTILHAVPMVLTDYGSLDLLVKRVIIFSEGVSEFDY